MFQMFQMFPCILMYSHVFKSHVFKCVQMCSTVSNVFKCNQMFQMYFKCSKCFKRFNVFKWIPMSSNDLKLITNQRNAKGVKHDHWSTHNSSGKRRGTPPAHGIHGKPSVLVCVLWCVVSVVYVCYVCYVCVCVAMFADVFRHNIQIYVFKYVVVFVCFVMYPNVFNCSQM